MAVVKYEPKIVKLTDLRIGDLFKHDDRAFMRMCEPGRSGVEGSKATYYALNLSSGIAVYLSPEQEVETVHSMTLCNRE